MSQIPTKNPVTSSPKTIALIVTLLFAAESSSVVRGQVVPPPQLPPPTQTPPGPEVIEISPFIVDVSQDRGYRAENTLAGSRLNTPLRDTAASISVFTEEFLMDLGINEIDQLIEYSVGTQLELQDTNSGFNANNLINGQNVVRRVNIRGIRGSEGIDYFRSITPNDGYRIARYDESRGPNGILFGLSQAGGLINQSTLMANTNRDSGRVSYQFGNYGTSRVDLRLNKVIVPKRLAVALAAVDQENGGWREPDFKDKERLFGTITFTPTERITIRAMGERGNEYTARVAPYTISDSAMAWLDNRNALGVGAVTFAPTNVNPTAARQALGVVSRNANASNARRFVYIENDGALYDAAGTFLTGSYNNPAVRAPDGTPGVSGNLIRINDPSFVAYDINSGGPGMFRDQDLKNYTFTFDWRITDDLNLNVAHNYQHTDLINPALTGADPQLGGEANTTRGVNGPANPFVGRLYIDGNWISGENIASIKESRVTLSYDFDPKRRWLGTHRIAGLFSRSEEDAQWVGTRLALLGAPFNNAPVNPNNLVTTRVYIDETNPRAFIAPDWRNVPSQVNIGGQSYDVGWVSMPAGAQNSAATQKLDSRMIVLQSYFLDRRLVTTFGYREDSADIISYGYRQDPVLRTDIIDRTQSETDKVDGVTRTQGLVFHATDWLSLIGNWSTNIGVPTFTNRLLPDGRIPAPTQGKGRDFGFALDLFERRLSFKAVYFKTQELGQTSSGGIDAAFNQRNIRIAQAFESVLVGAGRPYTTATWQPIRESLTTNVNATSWDMDSDGYEVSMVANPTPNWRFTANYSYTDRIQTNTSERDAIPWYGFTSDGKFLVQGVTQNSDGSYSVNAGAFAPEGTVARWIGLGGQLPAANITTLTTSASVPVAREIQDLITFINDRKLSEEQRWGLRPHIFSMFNSYDFTQGRLKGFTIGAGYRWRSAQIIGLDSAGEEMRGRILSAADLMMRYRHPVNAGRIKGSLTYQINVSNLFDRGGIMPQRFSSTPEYLLPGGRGPAYSRFDFIDPRSIRLTTTFSF